MSTSRLITFLISIILAVYAITTIPLQKGLDLQGGIQVILEAQPTEEIPLTPDAILGAMEVIRNRVDSIGLTEPLIASKGDSQIVVELPGIKDVERALSMIGDTARLEFVEAEIAPPNADKLSKDKLRLLAGDNFTLGSQEYKDKEGKVVSTATYFLKRTLLVGGDLTTAYAGTSQYGEPVVNIEFSPEGGRKFFDATKKNVGKPLAILLDGKLISAPNINEPIAGGKAQISGSFTPVEVKDMVIKLKAGALPIPVEIISNKIIGPTLGQDSVAKSKIAFLIGFSLVCLYMLLTYRVPGILSIMALTCYILMTFALLKTLNATLTLPGIAGLILTMGMAVDANVIIFERIKEIVKVEKSQLSAIHQGFNQAFVTILDANITTIIAATVLFWLGTGSIKGFAVTLSIGIVVSMYSAIFITKLLLVAVSSKWSNLQLFKG